VSERERGKERKRDHPRPADRKGSEGLEMKTDRQTHTQADAVRLEKKKKQNNIFGR